MKIKGVNFGSWLLMEGYILRGRNIPESSFKNEFKKINGERQLLSFEKQFRDNFITEEDFKNTASLGANTIRLPFNYKLIESKPYEYNAKNLLYIHKALTWADKYKLKIILDMHAAPGAQNCDWHGDSCGKALFWENRNYRERTCLIWEFIADRFKNYNALLGYDIINEPVLSKNKEKILKEFYKTAIKRIKAVDSKHTLFVEGSNWAQDINFLSDLIDDRVSVSIHAYSPISYTFNFTPFLKFPGNIEGEKWSESNMHKYLNSYYKFSQKNKVKIFVGEFGINWRGGYFGELKWLDGMLKTFDEYGFDYTYWTYKAVANNCFPDGVYQFMSNGDYVRREGPVFGWETYIDRWKSEKNKIADFWKTKNYTLNTKISQVLKKHFRK
ncbi:glycoside hydrolase family 5 protein [Elusimicrobiota bacterium]